MAAPRSITSNIRAYTTRLTGQLNSKNKLTVMYDALPKDAPVLRQREWNAIA